MTTHHHKSTECCLHVMYNTVHTSDTCNDAHQEPNEPAHRHNDKELKEEGEGEGEGEGGREGADTYQNIQ